MSTETENVETIFITSYDSPRDRGEGFRASFCVSALDFEREFGTILLARVYADGIYHALCATGHNVHIVCRDEFEAEYTNSCGVV